MSRLFGVEIRRALARRLVKLYALVAIIGIVIAGVSVFFNHSAGEEPTTPRPSFDELQSDPGAEFRACIENHPSPDSQERVTSCRELVPPPSVMLLLDDRYHMTTLRETFFGTTTPLVLVALILGASLIGAEWRANTIAVQLTWEPRRVRLLLAKALAATSLGAAFYLLAQVLLAGALTPAGLWRGTTAGMDAAWWRETAGILGRGTAYAGMAACLGFSLAAIGKNTTAALGIVFGYIALLEGALVGSIWPWMRQWLLLGNSIVFVAGGPSADVFGRSVTEAGILLAVYTVGVFALAAAWFARRDVT